MEKRNVVNTKGNRVRKSGWNNQLMVVWDYIETRKCDCHSEACRKKNKDAFSVFFFLLLPLPFSLNFLAGLEKTISSLLIEIY